VEIFNYDKGIQEIGIRPGEKMHETLISREETFRAEDCGDYYKIIPEAPDMDYRQYYFKGQRNNHLPEEGYTSANTKRLSKKELKELLLSLNEINEELKNFKKQQ
jgi:UDP-glucose 4-epimerase